MKLTRNLIRKLISEEIEKKAEEVDADSYADALEKKIDFVKALKLEEARLSKRLKRIKEQKERAMDYIKSSI
jgi:hypothetical protein